MCDFHVRSHCPTAFKDRPWTRAGLGFKRCRKLESPKPHFLWPLSTGGQTPVFAENVKFPTFAAPYTCIGYGPQSNACPRLCKKSTALLWLYRTALDGVRCRIRNDARNSQRGTQKMAALCVSGQSQERRKDTLTRVTHQKEFHHLRGSILSRHFLLWGKLVRTTTKWHFCHFVVVLTIFGHFCPISLKNSKYPPTHPMSNDVCLPTGVAVGLRALTKKVSSNWGGWCIHTACGQLPAIG